MRAVLGVTVAIGALTPTVLGASASAAVRPASAAPVCSPTYGPAAPTISLSHYSIEVGTGATIAVDASGGFCPNVEVTIVVHSTPVTLGQTMSNSSGGISALETLPTDLPVGLHTIIATDATGRVATAQFEIVAAQETSTALPTGAPPKASSGSGLAFTGTDAALTIGVAAGCVGVGGVLVLSTRKRRRAV